jgi:hypothetical protein
LDVIVNVLLVAVSLAYLAFLTAIETWCAFTDHPTISRRIQDFVHSNYQIAGAFLVLAGWLIAHFTGYPG